MNLCIFRSGKGFPKLAEKESKPNLKNLNKSAFASARLGKSRDVKLKNNERYPRFTTVSSIEDKPIQSFLITEGKYNLEQNIGKIKK
jgi:hypothetical protein